MLHELTETHNPYVVHDEPQKHHQANTELKNHDPYYNPDHYSPNPNHY